MINKINAVFEEEKMSDVQEDGQEEFGALPKRSFVQVKSEQTIDPTSPRDISSPGSPSMADRPNNYAHQAILLLHPLISIFNF